MSQITICCVECGTNQTVELPSTVVSTQTSVVYTNGERTPKRRVIQDLTENDNDANNDAIQVVTPRKTPRSKKRLPENDQDDDVIAVDTPSKRQRSRLISRPSAVASSSRAAPPPIFSPGGLRNLGAPEVEHATPKTPSPTTRRARIPTSPSTNEPRTPRSRDSSFQYAPSSAESQAFFSPASTPAWGIDAFTTKREESPPSPSPSRGRGAQPLSAIKQEMDWDEHSIEGSSLHNPVDVDALHDRAAEEWYRQSQERTPTARGNAPRPATQPAAPDSSPQGPRPITLADIWKGPLNERGEPNFPMDGPECRSCKGRTIFRRTSATNRNGNVQRPFYLCCQCKSFSTWADRRGVSEENLRCDCGEPSREDCVGEASAGRLPPGTLFWTCWQKKCRFFAQE